MEEVEMEKANCPFCKEEVVKGAIICKHCHERIFTTKEDWIMAAIARKFDPTTYVGWSPPSPSPCRAWCHYRHRNDKSGLSACLKECELYEAIAALAERMNRELFDTFTDIVWGGDIDPLPLERAVRGRFSAMPEKR
jgi:hypothetical protein